MARTETLSTSVTYDYVKRFEQRTREKGLNKSQYLRQIIIRALDREEEEADPNRCTNVFKDLYEGKELESLGGKFRISLRNDENDQYNLMLAVFDDGNVFESKLDSGVLWAIVSSFEWRIVSE